MSKIVERCLGEVMVQKAVSASESVFASTKPEGQEPLRQEVQQLTGDWDSLRSLIADTQRTLDKCLAAWNDFNEIRERTKTWIAEFQKKVCRLYAIILINKTIVPQQVYSFLLIVTSACLHEHCLVL